MKTSSGGQLKVLCTSTLVALFLSILCGLWNKPVATLFSSSSGGEDEDSPASTCSVADEGDSSSSFMLTQMKFDIGDGEETFLAYLQPDVRAFYQWQAPGDKPIPPKYAEAAANFNNMSNKKLQLFWEGKNGRQGGLLGYCGPFQSMRARTFPGNVLYFASETAPNTRLVTFTVSYTRPRWNYYYDPYEIPSDPEATKRNLEALGHNELRLYKRHRKNRLFNDKYFEVTGREYIAMYPRNKPFHKMWRADYFGQQYWVSTKEAHFSELPPQEKLGEITGNNARVIPSDASRHLQEYRSRKPMNMHMTVLSCAPQVFEIKNFLSKVEIDHVMKLAKEMTLSRSRVYGEVDASVRTSYNTWVKRETSPIIDAIYRRAADVFRVDEALLRHRGDGEYPNLGTKRTVAESLQLVHYEAGQKLDPHHDFVIADINNPYQPARFATLLIYLNDGFVGGDTVFPRWVNAETSEALKVVPEKGKAILFYSHLPDGNFDDRSLHEALAVKDGEKWVMNLWLWDPIYKQ